MIAPMPFLSLVIAAAAGYFGVRLWVPGAGGRSSWGPLLQAGLGFGLGIGTSSCLYFLLLISGAAKLPVILTVEVLVLLSAAAADIVRRRAAAPPAPPIHAATRSFSWNWVLAIA